MSSLSHWNSVWAMRAMLLTQSIAQSPLGMGVSWARATPAKVAARMAKDFILTVGGVERLGRRGYSARILGIEVRVASSLGLESRARELSGAEVEDAG
jgi:hypothetical protein